MCARRNHMPPPSNAVLELSHGIEVYLRSLLPRGTKLARSHLQVIQNLHVIQKPTPQVMRTLSCPAIPYLNQT